MVQLHVLNVLFLCGVNVIFMIAGIFLNLVVIISLWRSSQIGKKLCYFMIRILSCFDLIVVAITHPVVILSTITSMHSGDLSQPREKISLDICVLLQSFSLMSLLVLNIERFLAIAYPFFHQRIVTREKVFSCLITILLFVTVGEAVAVSYKIGSAMMTVILSFAVCLFAFLNYKIFIIAKSKQINEIIMLGPQSSVHTRKKKHFQGFQHICTCTLAVVCSLTCTCPPIVYLGLCWKWETPLYGKQFSSLALWATTSVSMSSTFNCLIFFWRNTVLRREAMEIMKCSHFI
jgi:hypothetical protein